MLSMLGKKLGGGAQGMGQLWVTLASWLEAQAEAEQVNMSGREPSSTWLHTGVRRSRANCPWRKPVSSGPALTSQWPQVGGHRLGRDTRPGLRSQLCHFPHAHSTFSSSLQLVQGRGASLPDPQRWGRQSGRDHLTVERTTPKRLREPLVGGEQMSVAEACPRESTSHLPSLPPQGPGQGAGACGGG